MAVVRNWTPSLREEDGSSLPPTASSRERYAHEPQDRRHRFAALGTNVTGRDNQRWLKMWRNDQTDFHQLQVNPLLIRFWASLDLKRPSAIFVPLCGKSLDLLWLAQQGNRVIGVELSPVAVKAFFEETGLIPRKSKRGDFTLWQSGRIKILCGDFFRLAESDVGEIDVVYDRAALTALPEDLREQYVAHLRHILPLSCSIFLLTTEDANPAADTDILQGLNGAVDGEIKSLYENYFDIEIAHAESASVSDLTGPGENNITVEQKVYRLTPRAD
jgi:thiopurine S-methyltransferase